AAMNAYALLRGKKPYTFPEVTVIGSLLRYITTPAKRFQPMNANWGILPSLDVRIRDRGRRRLFLRERALSALRSFIDNE
ncbi:MAG: methylenetetrahydrofolate--tRNA-(uracil(54)-C(5))-methyltransferase (FADH(2)-oxidizing) TrmFO, partial [Synergistetes bacterium]|nr:methylenetetrahydrofolate--tRNA-(uracil(54)-C(5))-methyltransferase (FADH(2)-oxidizing) TrmFO [Synergistota bacterium]